MPLFDKVLNWLEDVVIYLPAFSHYKKERAEYDKLLEEFRKEASYYTRRNITEDEIRKVGRQWNRKRE